MSDARPQREARPLGALVEDVSPVAVPGPAVIAGRFVRLERLAPPRHAGAIHAANEGADWVWDYLGYGPFPSSAAYRLWQEQMAALADPFFYAIVREGQALGVAAFLRIEPAHRVVEIGHIQMAPPLQRSTAASEAIMLMVRWAIEAGYRRVEWKCDALNAPSRRAALRFGFSFEGIFRQHLIVKGRNRDTAWYAMTDRDWPVIEARWKRWLDPANFVAEGRAIRRLGEA
ncbi:MAG: GNAT family protein [Paracoccus sp. (in: a-proteobacteria)]|nr:GNAT family protein [Paracoccus sp. (in: a-proteobacteria)]